MVNKQQVQPTTTTAAAAEDEYPCTREELLEEYTKEEEIINQLRKVDDETGLTASVMEIYSDKRKDLPISKVLIQYEENHYKRNKHLKWLSNVCNRDGSFRTLEDLVNNHDIKPEEIELFTGGTNRKFPYREINQIHRIRLLDGTEYIVRYEQWFGLTKSCAIVTCPVVLGRYLHPSYKTEFIKTEKDNEDSPTVRVVKVEPNAYGQFAGVRKYTDRYSEEKMRKYLRHSVGTFGRLDTITLVKQNASNPVGCRDIERAITEDFDTLFDDLSQIRPAVDIKELVSELRRPDKNTEHEVYG